MQYLVCEISAPHRGAGVGGGYAMQAKDTPKEYWARQSDAEAYAADLSRKNPGRQFGVFSIAKIYESKATLIEKVLDENGQIVVKK